MGGSLTNRLRRAAAIMAVLLAAAVLGCGGGDLSVSVLGDMEKPVGQERPANSPSFFNKGTITLHGAGNEVVAFQVLLGAGQPFSGLDARVSDLAGPATLQAQPNIQVFLAYYIRSADASYSWGPGGAGVLPWRERDWPDALIPLRDPYDPAGAPVAAPFAVDPRRRRNQSLWVDIFIPAGQPAGAYRGSFELLRDGHAFKTLPIALTVHPFSLPDQNHVDAYGELYRETGVMFDSGVKFKADPQRAWPVYKRYLQMAHAHRFLATHRAADGPLPRTPDGQPADRVGQFWSDDLGQWTQYTAPILDGSIFTAGEGYAGPSPGVGPGFFPTPFPEAIVGGEQMRQHLAAHGGGIDPALLEPLRKNAALLWTEIQRRGWTGIRFFAYILDEVDGLQDTSENSGGVPVDNVTIHRAIRQVQDALDAGTGGHRRIHLLWTSHADAGQWVGTPANLVGTVSWWVPNGHAVNAGFFQERARRGETVWFYHSGQPAVGNHTINQNGIDLRMWGLLCWRYGLQGSFWWSMMDFAKPYSDPRFNPYDSPSYKEEDTRWGNGVLFYPGSRLTMIGCSRNIAGPIPSMRMKAYRRGLQDVEYFWLARSRGHGEDADQLLRTMIPAGFSEAPQAYTQGTWSMRAEDYYHMRRKLAQMIK